MGNEFHSLFNEACHFSTRIEENSFDSERKMIPGFVRSTLDFQRTIDKYRLVNSSRTERKVYICIILSWSPIVHGAI